MRPGSSNRVCRQRGFTYFGVLLTVAISSASLLVIVPRWSATAARQQKTQRDWVLAQYQQAIRSYVESSTGAAKQYPPSLQDLLQDRRGLVVRRHLRQLFVDPATGRPDWHLERAADGGIRAVRADAPKDLRSTGQTPARPVR